MTIRETDGPALVGIRGKFHCNSSKSKTKKRTDKLSVRLVILFIAVIGLFMLPPSSEHSIKIHYIHYSVSCNRAGAAFPPSIIMRNSLNMQGHVFITLKILNPAVIGVALTIQIIDVGLDIEQRGIVKNI